jgi:hypothetical protein
MPVQRPLPPKSAWLANGPLQKLTPTGWKKRQCVLDNNYCMWISRAPRKAVPGQARMYPLYGQNTDLQLDFKRKTNGLFGEEKELMIIIQSKCWPSVVHLRALGANQMGIWYELVVGGNRSTDPVCPQRSAALRQPAPRNERSRFVDEPYISRRFANKILKQAEEKPKAVVKAEPEQKMVHFADSSCSERAERRDLPPALLPPSIMKRQPVEMEVESEKSAPAKAPPLPPALSVTSIHFSSDAFRSQLQQEIQRRQKKKPQEDEPVTKPELKPFWQLKETPMKSHGSVPELNVAVGKPVFSRWVPPMGPDTKMQPRPLKLTRSYSI